MVLRIAIIFIFILIFDRCTKRKSIAKNNFPKVVLKETCKLPSTKGQLDSRLFDVCFEKITSSECGDSKEMIKHKSKIFKTLKTDSTLIVKVKTTANCCYSFLGDIDVYNDSSLNIIYHPYGQNHCACDCEFILNYDITLNCLIDEGKSETLKMLILNNDIETLIKL